MRFTVYSKHGCPYCEKIKQVLELAELQHQVYFLDEDYNRYEFYNAFGDGSTFPQIMLNDQQKLGGCSDTVKYLQENNLV
jgi:glutaredoxin 3